MSTAETSFAKDIQPTLGMDQYRGPMMWRLDLAQYDEVRQNAELIYDQISQTDPDGRMPPPEFPALSSEFIATFKRWMDEGCPP